MKLAIIHNDGDIAYREIGWYGTQFPDGSPPVIEAEVKYATYWGYLVAGSTPDEVCRALGLPAFDPMTGEELGGPDGRAPQDFPDRGDPVNSPAHYTGFSNGAEVIDITENLPFNRGNAVKYLARAGHKDSSKELEDLKKSRWYTDREIARIEGELA